MTEDEFKNRLTRFAHNVLEFSDRVPQNRSNNVMTGQLIRCATSVGANYRAACRGKSVADMLAKMAISEEEADESIYWLELITLRNKGVSTDAENLMGEANEIVAMLVASIKTLRSRKVS
jgi:four helix bundle protein